MRSSLVGMRSSLVRMRSSLVGMRSSLVRMRSSLVRMRTSLVRMRSSLVRMRSSLVVRVSDCQCTSCNGPGFDPSIRQWNLRGGRWSSVEYSKKTIEKSFTSQHKLAFQPAENNKNYHLNASLSTLTREDYEKIPGGTGVEQRKYFT